MLCQDRSLSESNVVCLWALCNLLFSSSTYHPLLCSHIFSKKNFAHKLTPHNKTDSTYKSCENVQASYCCSPI